MVELGLQMQQKFSRHIININFETHADAAIVTKGTKRACDRRPSTTNDRAKCGDRGGYNGHPLGKCPQRAKACEVSSITIWSWTNGAEHITV